MKKNKKIYGKVLGLFLFIFICFSFFSSSLIAIAYWEYQNPDKTKTEICEFADNNEAGCNARVKTACGQTTTGVCVPSTDGCNSSMVAIDCPTVVNITGNKNTNSNGTYTLLAPIGEMKTAPTNFGDYVDKIFLIAIGLCGVLAVIMLIIGGIQYMGDESIFVKTEAKKQMINAVLGLLIALGAWVLLNTINPKLLNSSVTINAVSAEITPLYDRGATDPKQANGESVRCTPVTSGSCSVANLTTALGVNATTATAMSKICNMESGGTSIASGTDVCKPSNVAFSFGLFQINLAANGIYAGTDCVGLFDRAVSSSDAISPKYTSGFTCSLLPGKQSQYDTCKARLLDPATNLAIAKNLLASNPNKSPWIGDKKYCASAFN